MVRAPARRGRTFGLCHLVPVMRALGDTADAVAAEIASAQEGVAARRQLLAAGVTRAEIEHRLRTGALLPEFPGVYRIGHRAPSTRAHYMAAVLACGDEVILAGFAAAHLLALVKGASPKPEVMALKRRRIDGIVVRRTRRIDRRDVARSGPIPLTTVPRTLVDLAGVMTAEALARACHEAGVRYRTTPAHVEAILRRRPNSPGARRLRAVMHGDVPVTLSELERAFLELLREAGLPLPLMNRVAGGRRVDCRWPDHGLTVELQSYRFHNSRHAWEQDHRRRREAYARGDEFRTYAWADVFEDPAPMLRELAALLG